MQLEPGIPLAWRPPFGIGNAIPDRRPPGETLEQMALSMKAHLPKRFFERGIICVNGTEVPRVMWSRVRPKAGLLEPPAFVTLHYPLAGGGGKGGGAKTIISVVAALALIVVTQGIAGGWLATGGLFEAGTLSAKLLAGAVGLGGALAIAALTPPPSVAALNNKTSENSEQARPAAASGNVLQPGGAIPRVIGTMKIFPPLIGEPIVELVGDDEYVEAGFCLNGPHALSDILVDGVSIEDADDVEFETREGFPGDEALSLVTRQGKTITPNISLSTHKVDTANQARLADPSNPSSDLPKWQAVSSRNNPDEIWMHFFFPSGISINGSTSEIGVPLRLRIRKRGTSSWTNLPELHVSDSTLQQRRRAIIFKFETAQTPGVIPSQRGGFCYASIAVPGQSVAPATSGWAADSYFVGASGADYLNAGNVGGSKVQNIAIYENRVEVFLDPATFTPGIYEIGVMRGAAYDRSNFTDATYSYSGSVKDLFTYSSTTAPAIVMSRANLADMMQLGRVISIWNEVPVTRNGALALLAIKARNREIRQVSVIASGYVKDWDGSGWNSLTTTSCPAPHYADVLCGAQNIDPLPLRLRDDTALVAWRTLCLANGWECNAIIDDYRTQDVLSLIASCGYAKPYQSELYGVTVDNDRSGDAPVQLFSRLNARNVKMERSFARQVEGFLVNYLDKDADYEPTQEIVYRRDRSLATPGLLETINYDGLVELGPVRARALFDLDQVDKRSMFYTLETDLEGLTARKGSLVALQHDALTDRAGDARIKRKIVKDGDIVALELDSKIQTANEPDMHTVADMHEVDDMHKVGLVFGVAIRHNDGTLSTHQLDDEDGERDFIHLADPIADDGTIDAAEDNPDAPSLLVSGQLSSVYRRLLVAAIAPNQELGATLTLVDEAPELVRYAA